MKVYDVRLVMPQQQVESRYGPWVLAAWASVQAYYLDSAVKTVGYLMTLLIVDDHYRYNMPQMSLPIGDIYQHCLYAAYFEAPYDMEYLHRYCSA